MEENILTQNGERLREGRRVCSFASAPYDESNHESRRQTDGAGQGRAGQGRAGQGRAGQSRAKGVASVATPLHDEQIPLLIPRCLDSEQKNMTHQ